MTLLYLYCFFCYGVFFGVWYADRLDGEGHKLTPKDYVMFLLSPLYIPFCIIENEREKKK